MLLDHAQVIEGTLARCRLVVRDASGAESAFRSGMHQLLH